MNLNEEQRRKVNQFIAEKRGWTNIHAFNKHKEGGTQNYRDGDLVGYFNGVTKRHIPDYTRSLDACHESLTWLSQNFMDAEQWEAFGHKVEEMHPTATLTTNSGVDYYDFATLLCTPSDQIAVALFLTLGGEL